MTHIGRLDLDVDVKDGGIVNYKWNLIELNDTICEFDSEADEYVDRVLFEKKEEAEDCYLCDLEKRFEHKSRLEETELGDLISDIFLESYKSDFIILQSGSIRLKEFGPRVTLENLRKLYPYDDSFVNVKFTGAEIKKAFEYLFSLKPDGSVMNGTFQYSKGFKLIADIENYKERGCRMTYIGLNGEELQDEKVYTVGMTNNCANKFIRYFGFDIPEEKISLVSISTFSDLAKWMLSQKELVKIEGKGRFEILHREYLDKK